MNSKKFPIDSLLWLFFLYLNVVLTFAILYLLLDLSHVGTIVDHYADAPHSPNILYQFGRSIYFSAITLLSVGYGDITPFGLSRAMAIFEAMIGYILPPALVIRYAFIPTRQGRTNMKNLE